ncbi:MAG: hypothetical protein J0H75_04595, partial [Rhizobiales bacterium]|nr:hypothetical protein [Hyphomicrobiales bacterium]
MMRICSSITTIEMRISATDNVAAATKAAKEFEGVFIAQFLGSMFQGIPTDGPMGGGQGEDPFAFAGKRMPGQVQPGVKIGRAGRARGR